MELAVNQLIKIILGVLVVVVVIMGLYLFFSGYVLNFFDNLIPDIKEDNLDNSNSIEEETPNTEILTFKTVCESCGDGLSNLCDEKECLNLGNCKYSLWNKINPCVEIK